MAVIVDILGTMACAGLAAVVAYGYGWLLDKISSWLCGW